ncbi:MAG: response regulator, partial [Methanogenium sp.]|nr:response regulator [Methanogenium sp.]
MIHTLLVDDEPMLLDIAKLFIERTGEVTVETAESAEEGYGKIKTRDYDIVVSDYEMPGMNGIEFLRTLREEANSIPFIIFTGRGREDVVIEALNYGVDYYIQKGGDPRSQFTELVHMIIRAVEEQRVRINL